MTPPRAAEGDRFGRYRLLERMSSGRIAEVFRARREEEGVIKDVVLKVIHQALADDRPFVEMFVREARLAALLDHPNVVSVFDFGTIDSRQFIAMELVRGLSLASVRELGRQQATPLPNRLLARVLCGTCEGLHYAHSLADGDGDLLGIVHRDVSPENILVTLSGSTQLLGFGMARASEASTVGGGRPKICPSMSPEQVRGDRLDHRADIYAVGVVAYELIAGRPPFDREQAPDKLRDDIVSKPPPPLSSLCPDVPEPLVRTVERAMAKDPQHRYPTALAMRLDLEGFIASSGGAVLEFHVAEFIKQFLAPLRADPTRPDIALPTFLLDAAEVLVDGDDDLPDPADQDASGADEETRDLPTRAPPAERQTRRLPSVPPGDRVRPPPSAPVVVRFLGRTPTGAGLAPAEGLPPAPAEETVYDDIAAQVLNQLESEAPEEETARERIRRRMRGLIERARAASVDGDEQMAVVAVDLALRENPDSAIAQKLIAENISLLLDVYERYLGGLAQVPRPSMQLRDLLLDQVDHRLGFLLSRIDGQLTYEEILDVCGMKRLEALRNLAMLLLHEAIETG